MSEQDFTKIGREYDAIYRAKMSDLEAITLDVLETLKPNKKAKVCDVGAGTGLVADLLKQAGWNFDYLGIEPSALYEQLKDRAGIEKALRDNSDSLKSFNGSFDAVIYSKSLHEILISKLLDHYKLESNKDLHDLYLQESDNYQSRKQLALKEVLEDSFNSLRPTGLVVVSDMEYPGYLSQTTIDESIKYVYQTFKHLNYREQTLPIIEIETAIEATPWRIVDRRETAKRKDPNIKTKVYSLAIQKVM